MGRYGSDEFLIVLPGVPEEEAREVMPLYFLHHEKIPLPGRQYGHPDHDGYWGGRLNERATGAQDLVDAACAELCGVKLRHGPELQVSG